MKTIVITGGSKGIGRALIMAFAREECHMITCGRNEADMASLVKEVTKKYPKSTLTYIIADLSTKEGRKSFTAYLKGKTVDVLVNNAGLFLQGQVHTEEEGRLDLMIRTNLYSAYDISRAVIPQMKARQNGQLINICSTASVTPYTNGGSYCISKYAMLGMTKVLREELKDEGIRVTAVLPGATYTPSWDGAGLPEERLMPPEDVAAAALTAFHVSSRSVVEEVLIRPQKGDLG